MTANKPDGVGIEKISSRSLINRGVELGFVDKDEPFVGGLLPDWAIREFVTVEGFVDYDECPPGVVSYGLTSSGYDVRVSGIFKVFTNALCETVSPKNMRPGCFMDVDLSGHYFGKHGVSNDLICKKCGAIPKSTQGRLRCPLASADVPTTIKIPPNSFALAETVELLHIPRNINCLCLGKSTYARCGIIMNFTPFEPGWRGVVTIEISNSTPLPVEIFAWEGIGQAQFSMLIGGPQKSYSEKKSAKYMDQPGLTLPSVK